MLCTTLVRSVRLLQVEEYGDEVFDLLENGAVSHPFRSVNASILMPRQLLRSTFSSLCMVLTTLLSLQHIYFCGLKGMMPGPMPILPGPPYYLAILGLRV